MIFFHFKFLTNLWGGKGGTDMVWLRHWFQPFFT